MKLYTDNKGAWVGTQAEAKQKLKDFEIEDVPTDKPRLLEFLNWNAVGGNLERIEILTDEPQEKHPQSCSINDISSYDVKDVVLNCPKEHLGQALAAIITRLHDMQGEI